MTTPKMVAGMTPKMPAGMTPNSHAVGSFGFSPALLGQSPAAFLAKHRSPAPSGNFNSPGMLAALGVDLRGTGMNVGGHMGTPPQLPPDENKKRELAEILKLLASRPGRISMSAVERLAEGMGLYCYKDLEPNGPTTLSLAAKIFLLDIVFMGNRIERVQLSFEKTAGPSSDLAPQAAAIFQKNLTQASKAPSRTPLLTPSLSDFSENLHRLYRTDKLSASLNCFTAITGIYQSLQKIYEYERDNMGGEVAALCFGNGRPRMHTRGKVGLSIDYWKERPSVCFSNQGDGEDKQQRLWRVLIEVEEIPQDFGNMNMNPITPVRASNHWVSEEVKKPRVDNLFGEMEELITDWLEPPLEELMDVPGDPSQSRPPSARFLARLDPPVVVPLQDQIEIHPGSMAGISTLEGLLFPDLPQNASVNRRVYVPHSEGEGASHRYQLHSEFKPVFARQVTEVPFSHPRDLVPIFRTLRQYAALQALLESCFVSPGSLETPVEREYSSGISKSHDPLDDFNSFLCDDEFRDSTGSALPIDVTLEPEHGFGLRVVFPSKSPYLTNLQIQVGKNAELKVYMAPTEQGREIGVGAKAIEKALRASEDIGLVVEWIRQQQEYAHDHVHS